MDKALSGIRIIDMTHNQAGPACTQILGFLGADVIKLEEPKGGDVARQNMRDQNGDSLFFLVLNANKRSLTLDLKTEEGKKLFRQVIAAEPLHATAYLSLAGAAALDDAELAAAERTAALPDTQAEARATFAFAIARSYGVKIDYGPDSPKGENGRG